MKRLGVFVGILMLSVGLFGGFSHAEKAFAEDTYESISAQVLSDIAATQTKFDLKKAEATQYAYNYKQMTEVLTNVKDAYNSAVTAAKNESLSVYPGQIKAIAVASNVLSSETTRINTILNDEHRAVFSQLSRELNTKSLQYNQLSRGINQDPDGLITKDSSSRISNSSANTVTTPIKKGEVSTGDCTFFKWTLTSCINEGVTWFIKNTFLQVGGFLVWLTANMFNYAVQQGILQFSQWAPSALYPIWTIVRQIISLVIVFVGLYLGFMYVLGKEDKFEKYIPWVIVFGIFVNFSYPFTRALIDISNIVSLNIYASAVGSEALTASFTSQQTAGALIMNKLGLQGLILSATSGGNTSILSSVTSIPGALVAVAYVFYAAYIFFQVTAIMVIRTLSLVFITIVSPLLLVDSVLPLLGEKAKELRGIFLNQLLVGPVFMIMLAITLKFLDVFKTINLTNAGSIGGGVTAGQGGVDTVVVFFNIIMMLGMLHIMIKVTKNVAGKLGEMATNAMGTVSGVGLGLATGGLGFVGRQGIGRLAANAQHKGWVSKDPNSMTGRIANTLSTSSFDLRNSSVIAGGAGKLGMNKGILGMGGMGGGSASKTSFQAGSDAKAKKIEVSAGARFKTKYERDIYKKDDKGNVEYDKDGLPVLLQKKGDIDKEQVEAREKFMVDKGGSLFLTADQKQKIKDSESDIQAERFLAGHTEKKTKTEKEAYMTDLRQQLTASKNSDPKLESAKSQALLKTINDIGEKDKKEAETFEKEKDKALEIYRATKEERRGVYLAQQTKEIQEAIKASENIQEEVGQDIAWPTLDPITTQTQTLPPPSGSTPSTPISSPLPPQTPRPSSGAATITKREDETHADFFARRRKEKQALVSVSSTPTVQPEAPKRSEPAPVEPQPKVDEPTV
jgi:hypothetical protein